VGRRPGEHEAGRQRLVEIRCGFAQLAEREAETAEARAADVRQRTEAQLTVLAEVQSDADPTANRAAKENAHRTFKSAASASRDRSGVEAAAFAWLEEINRINARLRVAQVRLRRERDTADSLLAERDRLAATAEAARAMADSARDACLAAQRGVLEEPGPDEAEVAAPVTSRASAASPSLAPTAGSTQARASSPALARAGAAPEAAQIEAAEMAAVGATPEIATGQAGAAATAKPPSEGQTVDLRARPPQVIVRLLNRDLWTLNWLVDQLAAGSASARSAWKLRLSSFVDAAIAAAIDETCFDFLPGNAFWDTFTKEQAREIARGLAALGYRYDGLGAFADGRVPDQRDLALAIGSAGLYPVKVRYWPKPSESAHLFQGVRVATEAFLAGRAPSLTLGELVIVLGRRAEMLADLWNEWPRVRPLLLSAAVA
jgi:hypothetical protein